VSLLQFRVYTRHPGESALQLVESGDLSTRTLHSGVDPYANLTIGVSLVNSAGLESRIELIHFVGSKHPNTAITTTTTTTTTMTAASADVDAATAICVLARSYL